MHEMADSPLMKSKTVGGGKFYFVGVFRCFVSVIVAAYAVITIAIRLRYDHTTKIRLRRIARACFHSTRAKMNMSILVVVVSQSNRTQIVISITSVVVECVMVSSYRSRIVVVSQLLYRLYLFVRELRRL